MQNYTNPKHTYLCMDFLEENIPQKVDVCHCNGTLENVWDINLALKALVNNSKKWIYASSSTGYHPDLQAHKYTWVEEKKVYSSLLSPIESRKILNTLGCTEIQIYPSKKTNSPDSKEEIIIIAKVN